jgi:hypothetical protein
VKPNRRPVVSLFLLMLLSLVSSLWAGARKVYVQGKLTDSGGVALSGAQTVTFKLYDAATAGMMVWTSGVLSVTPASGGLFNVPLQDGTPSLDSVSFVKPYYLGITVGGDAEMTPRQELGASALSYGSPKDFTVNNNLSVLNGRVGIGTATPGEALEVRGNVKLGNLRALTTTNWGYSSGYPVVLVGPSTGTGSVSIGYDPSGNPNGSFTGDGREVLFRNGVQFVTPNSANNAFNLHQFVLKDGNVGMGTGNPQTRLHLVSNSSEFLRFQNNAGSYGVFIEPAVVGDSGDLEFVPHSAGMGYQFYTRNSSGAGTHGLAINRDGKVGIGTSNPQYALDVMGTIRGNNLSPSDSRLKKNVRRLPEDSLRKLSQLNGVSFEWDRKKLKEVLRPASARKSAGLAQEAMTDMEAQGFPETPQIGLIAQEVENAFPSLVETDPSGVKSIYYMGVTAVLVEALKAQQKQIEDLTSRIKALEKK